MKHPKAVILATIFVAFFILGTQVDLLPALMWHDQQRLLQIVLLASFVAVIAPRLRGGLRLGLPTLASFLGIAVVGAVSAANAALPYWAWMEWSLLLSLVVAAFLVAILRSKAGEAFDRYFTVAIFAICCVIVLRFLGTYIGAVLAHSQLDTRELSSMGFSNRRFLGQMQTLTLPLLALPMLVAHKPRIHLASFVLLALWWLLAFVSATRGTFFAMAIASAVAACYLGSSGRRWVAWQAAGLTCGAALYALLFFLLPEWLGIDTSVESRLDRLFSSSGRIESWVFTLSVVADNPLTGVGPMHLAYWLSPAVPVAHPHNSFLQIAAEWGVPAAIASGTCVVLAITSFIRRYRFQYATPLSVGLVTALIGGAVQSLVDGVIVMPMSQVLLVILGGWALGFYEAGRYPVSIEFRPLVSTRHVVTLLACLVAGLATLSWRQFDQLSARQAEYLSVHPSYLHPRFWQQGWIGNPHGQE